MFLADWTGCLPAFLSHQHPRVHFLPAPASGLSRGQGPGFKTRPQVLGKSLRPSPVTGGERGQAAAGVPTGHRSRPCQRVLPACSLPPSSLTLATSLPPTLEFEALAVSPGTCPESHLAPAAVRQPHACSVLQAPVAAPSSPRPLAHTSFLARPCGLPSCKQHPPQPHAVSTLPLSPQDRAHVQVRSVCVSTRS